MAATVSCLFFISWPSSALSDVCSQKSAVKDFDEQGGKKQERAKCVRRKGKLGMGARWKSLIPSMFWIYSFSAATHFSVTIPHFLFLSSSFSDTHHTLHITLLPARTNTRLNSQPRAPAAIRRDSASDSISRLVSIWHRASRPLRHSPVPPHSSLLVTWDNWGRNPTFENGGEKITLGLAVSSTQDINMFLKVYFKKIHVMSGRWRNEI